MGLSTRVGDKAGALGTIVSAMGCASCFPVIGSGDGCARPGVRGGVSDASAWLAKRLAAVYRLGLDGRVDLGFRFNCESPRWPERLRAAAKTRMTALSISEVNKRN